MQLISQKLTYAKVEQSQRRNAEEWKKTVRIEIEKCVSQFEAEEREGV
jgi:hypothetical protein